VWGYVKILKMVENIFLINDYSINIAHFYCLEYEFKYRSTKLEVDIRLPTIYLSTSLILKKELPFENKIIANI